RAHRTQVSNLRWSLVTRAQESRVDTLIYRFAQVGRGSQRDLAIRLRVHLSHVGKSRSEAIVVRTGQRILSLQIDVVCNHDQCTLFVFEIDAPGGVGQDYRTDAHSPKRADGKSDLVRRIAFVQVH